MKKLNSTIFIGLLIASVAIAQNKTKPPILPWIHNPIEGPDKSFIWPKEWKHNPIEGPDKSKMFPPDLVHNPIEGPDKSKMKDKNYVHNPIEGPDQSRVLPPDWTHNPIEGPDESKMYSPEMTHNPIEGPHQSKMFFRWWVHNPVEGPDESKMFPSTYYHNPIEGPDESKMFEYLCRHNPIEGPDKSKMFYWWYVHNSGTNSGDSETSETDSGTNSDFSKMYNPNPSTIAPNMPGTDKKEEIANNTVSQKLSLDVFPNPVKDVVSISPVIIPDFVNNAQVKLYDLSGKLVKTIELTRSTNNVVTINISDLSSGIYTGNIEMNGTPTLVIKKIVKQ